MSDLTVQTNTNTGFGAFKTPEIKVVGLDVNASDMKLPKIKLMQQTSQEATKSKGKIQPGQFYNTVTQVASDTVDCILLDQGKTMVMWKKPFKRGEEPLCRSFDGKRKAEGCGDGNCETCQFSSQNSKAWDTAKEKGLTKPDCNMGYVFLAIDCATKMPFRIIAAGASVKGARDFLNKLLPLGVSPFACKVTLTSKQEENDQGIFYTINFENMRQNDDCLNADGSLNTEAYKAFEDQSIAYKNLFMTQIVQNDVVDVDSSEPQTEAGGLF